MSGLPSDKTCYIDTLRLTPQEQARLLADLARTGAASAAQNRRMDSRLQYQQREGIVVQMHYPGGSIVTYLVRARNLSRGGIAFLHGTFAYPGSRCTVTLLTTDDRTVRVEGTIVRCQHIHKHVHDIGVRFDAPIRMRNFVAEAMLTREEPRVSEALPRFSGQALCIEDSISDRELISFHLKNLGMQVQATAHGPSVLDLASRTCFDVITLGAWLPGQMGPQVAQSLRANGYAGPIIALTADESEQGRTDALSYGCTCVLPKPYTVDTLVRTLAQHVPQHSLDDGQATVLMLSEFWPDHRMRPLICSFLSHLEKQIEEIRRLLDAARTDLMVRKLCLEIKGSAGGYGYPLISQAAQDLLLITRGAGIRQLREEFTVLNQFCASALQAVKNEMAAAPSANSPRSGAAETPSGGSSQLPATDAA